MEPTETETTETETPGAEETPSPSAEEQTYFGSHTEMIDDAGNPIGDALPAPKEEADLNADAAAADEAAKAGKVGDKAGPGQPDKTPTAPTEGFLSRFYKPDDKGVNQFQSDAAIKLLYPEGDGAKPFAYAPVNVKLEDPATTKAKSEELPAWKQDLEGERKYRTDLKTSYFSALDLYDKAIKANYTPEDARAYAQQESMKVLEEHFSERQYDAEGKRAEANEKRTTSESEMRAVRDQATKNEMAYHEAFGGQQGFHEVFFGYKDSKGQQQQGLASDYLWQMFKIANPEHKNGGWTAKDLGQKMENWYVNMAADPDSMKFLVEIARGKLMLDPTMKRMLIDKVRSTATGQNKANRAGNIRRGAAGQPTPRTPKAEEGTPSALHAFLNPAEPRENAEEVGVI